MTWLTDANNNRCSVEYFGSREAAQKALDSLENCSDCSDCSDCSECSNCSRCSECSECSNCSRCSECSRCSRCSDCSDCSDLENAAPIAGEAQKLPVPIVENLHQKLYAELRMMAKTLQEIETKLDAGLTVRKARVVNTDQMRISTAPMKPEDERG
jgi:hypothetical protein